MEWAEIRIRNGAIYCSNKNTWCAFTNMNDGSCSNPKPCRVGTEDYIKEQAAKEQYIKDRIKEKEARGNVDL